MALSNQPSENDLLNLINSQVSEGKLIDYKVGLSVNADEEKKEFLADVTSFANTSGGHLIIGMKEDKGLPAELPGIQIDDPDKTKLRLEGIIRDGISERIAGVVIHPVQLKNGNWAIVIYIPKSWLAPHMVSFKNSSRFYARNSAGKYQLDIPEIRQAFLFSEGLAERIKGYRLDRLSQIEAGSTPIPVSDNAKLILHSIPLSAFQTGQLIDLPTAGQNYYNFFGEQNFLSRYNLDGLLLFLNPYNEPNTLEYLQVFRASHIEYTNSFIIGSDLWGGPKTNKILITEVEKESIKVTKNILDYQKSLGVEPPIMIAMSMLHVKGYVFGNTSNLRIDAAYNNRSIDRDNLILPDVLIDEFPGSIEDVGKVLKPIFDAIWNAAGWPYSYNYKEGAWKPSR